MNETSNIIAIKYMVHSGTGRGKNYYFDSEIEAIQYRDKQKTKRKWFVSKVNLLENGNAVFI